MHRSARTRTALAAIALLLVPGVAACGSADSKDAGLPAAQGQKSAAKDTEKKADPENSADAQEKYDDCLRKNGVQVDANHTAQGDWDTFQAAQTVCKEFQDALPVQEIAPDAEAKIMESQLKLATCMRDLGYDYPDPGGNGSTNEFKIKPGQTPEEVNKDQMTCAEEAGLGGGMVSSSSTGGQ